MIGLRLDSEAGGAARSAAAGAQREVLRLSGVVHVVGGPDVLHGRVLAALLGPEERVLEDPARAARQAVGCAARNASAPRSTSCARCPASSRRRSTSLGRPMICGGGCANLGDNILSKITLKSGVGTIVETDDGHFMALRGPVTLRHMRFRLTDLDGNVVRLRGSSLSFVLYLDHV